MSDDESADRAALGPRNYERRIMGGPNAHRHWWRARHHLDGPVLGPLRIMFNYVVVYLSHHLPSLALKRWLFRRLGMRIGKNVTIASGVTLDYFYPELIEIGDNTILGMDALVVAHEFLHEELRIGAVRIGRDCLIGGRCLVLAGVQIGDGAIVSAMSLVHKSVPPRVLVVGVPIKIIRRLPPRGAQGPPGPPDIRDSEDFQEPAAEPVIG